MYAIRSYYEFLGVLAGQLLPLLIEIDAGQEVLGRQFDLGQDAAVRLAEGPGLLGGEEGRFGESLVRGRRPQRAG